jgi:hypothetical protein
MLDRISWMRTCLLLWAIGSSSIERAGWTDASPKGVHMWLVPSNTLCYGRTLLALFMPSIVMPQMQGTASYKGISAHALIIAKNSCPFLNIWEGCAIMHKLSVLCLMESAVSQAKRHIEVLPSSKPRVHRRIPVNHDHIVYRTVHWPILGRLSATA